MTDRERREARIEVIRRKQKANEVRTHMTDIGFDDAEAQHVYHLIVAERWTTDKAGEYIVSRLRLVEVPA